MPDTFRELEARTSGIDQVLIMTQPLGMNYGGILQAYALQRVLREMGLHAVTNDALRVPNRLRRSAGELKSRLLGRMDSQEFRAIAREPRRFVSENLVTVDLFKGRTKPDPASLERWDAFVVGSDQVWRAPYSNVPQHLCDFVASDTTKISYAASFGTADLAEYGHDLIMETTQFAKKFDAISVREDSAVDLCREYWGVEAEQHVDPTLLLTKDDYIELVERDAARLTTSPGELLTSVLDINETTQGMINAISTQLGLAPFTVLSQKTASRRAYYQHADLYHLPPVTHWLRGFMDASFVITDSFHGCVFAIIFNKPFIATGNSGRGMARFDSILRLFGLQDRLITTVDDDTKDVLSRDIDWNSVNSLIEEQRGRSVGYLTNHL